MMKEHGALRSTERLAEAGLIVVLVLAPLPLGSARPLPTLVLALVVAVLLLMTLSTRAAGDVLRGLNMATPAIMFAAVVLFVGVQIATFTPAAWHHPAWAAAAADLGAVVPGSIAVDRAAAIDGLIKWLTTAGLMYLGCAAGRDAVSARRIVLAAALSGTGWAIYGLGIYWSGNATVAWFDKWTYVTDLTGPFVNRNSFATYLGLSALAMLAILIMRAGRLPSRAADRSGVGSADRMGAALTDHAWAMGALFVLVNALILTHSRAGAVVGVLGAVVLVFATMRAAGGGHASGAALMIALAAAVMAVIAFSISGEALMNRIDGAFNRPAGPGDGRVSIHASTIAAISEHPWLGTGLGSFPQVFPAVRAADLPTGEVMKAHGDYLELILDLGVPAAAVLFAAMAWPVMLCLRGLGARRRDAVYPALGVAASVLVGAHATVDFSLQIPAVAALYWVILGVGVAQSRPTRAV